MASKGGKASGSSRSSTPDVFENEFSDDEGKSDGQDNRSFDDTDDDEIDLRRNNNQKENQVEDFSPPSPMQNTGPPAAEKVGNISTDMVNDKHGVNDKNFSIQCEIESDSEVNDDGSRSLDATVITLDEGDSDLENIFAAGSLETDAFNINTVDVDREEMDTGAALPGEQESHDDADERQTGLDVLYLFDWEIPAVAFDSSKRADSQFSEKKVNTNATVMKQKIIEALKSKKHKYPRIFHSKSNPGRELPEDRYGGLFSGGYGRGRGSALKKQMEMCSPLMCLSTLAKSMKVDVTQLFETVEKSGLTRLSFPCMQCYEKYGGLGGLGGGKGGAGMGDYADDDYYDDYAGGMGRSADGRCPKCGGAVLTLSSYRQMILKMREKLRAKNLLVHDVYPDGNCLFGAVIDQLRIKGDFRFTITTLRQGAVNYLRENPESDDGTHYAMFLTEETWDAYLTRMSLDGTWGDHMVLNAIATLVNHPLIIYGGLAGDGETVIYPKGCQPPPDPEKAEGEDKDCDITEESPPLTADCCELPPLYLGHFGESHYISLRPANWRDSLQESISRSTQLEPDPCLEPLQELTRRSLPAYCDSMLKTLFHLEYITSYRSDAIDVISPGRQETEKFIYEMMGTLINKLQPSVCEIESIGPDVGMVFPGSVESAPQKTKALSMLVTFCTPTDTKVCFNAKNARRFDLICQHRESDLPGQMKLVPNNPDLWKSVLEFPESGACVIKTFEVKPDMYSYFPVLNEFLDIGVYPVIAFRCRWPDEAYDWIARQRNASWLDDEIIKTVVSGYCHVVPALPAQYLNEVTCEFASPESIDGRTWLISFAAAEKKLQQHITSSQRHSFLLLQLYLSNLATEKVLSAEDEGMYEQLPYTIAKSIFFYACENIEASVWEKRPGMCFMKILQNLAIAMEEGFVPHFFIPQKNLLQFIPREITLAFAKRLRSYCSQPLVGLYFFLDQYSITTSEVGPFIDGIIEELFHVDQERDEESFFLQVVLPSFSTMLNTCTMQEEYRDAQLAANMIREEIQSFCGKNTIHTMSENGIHENQDLQKTSKKGGVGDFMPMSTILTSCVDPKQGGYCWCLALYMDLVDDTQISRDVNGDRPTVSIMEIFGPECTEELPDTRVDARYKIQTGDLIFPTVVEGILNMLGKDRAITRCLRYYVDTLHDLAGENIVIGNSTSGCGTACQHISVGLTKICSLFSLYVKLYNAYLRLNSVEEFRDLLPTLTKMAEIIGSPTYYMNLRQILKGLKEYDKAKEMLSKTTHMPQGFGSGGSSIMQAFAQILGGAGMDTYDTDY